MAHHGTSWDGWRRWRARRLRMVRLWMLRLLRMQHELLILALCLVCGAVAPLAVSSSEIHGMELVAGCTAIAGEMCHARMLSPVPDGLIVRGFDRPEWQWSPGHRGVDISLNGMHELLAPSDGAISFSGMVAGKSVVSIDTGPYTLTFEPAHTQLAVGDKVHRGKLRALGCQAHWAQGLSRSGVIPASNADSAGSLFRIASHRHITSHVGVGQ